MSRYLNVFDLFVLNNFPGVVSNNAKEIYIDVDTPLEVKLEKLRMSDLAIEVRLLSPFSKRVIASIFCSRVIPAIKKAPPNVRVVSNIWGADHNKDQRSFSKEPFCGIMK